MQLIERNKAIFDVQLVIYKELKFSCHWKPWENNWDAGLFNKIEARVLEGTEHIHFWEVDPRELIEE